MLLLWTLACATKADLTIDASLVAQVDPDARFVGRVVAFGEVAAEFDLDLATTTRRDLPALIHAGWTYGLLAFADLDGDGVCSPSPVDLPFIDVLEGGAAGPGGVIVWQPRPGDAARMADACGAFNPVVVDDTGDSG